MNPRIEWSLSAPPGGQKPVRAWIGSVLIGVTAFSLGCIALIAVNYLLLCTPFLSHFYVLWIFGMLGSGLIGVISGIIGLVTSMPARKTLRPRAWIALVAINVAAIAIPLYCYFWIGTLKVDE